MRSIDLNKLAKLVASAMRASGALVTAKGDGSRILVGAFGLTDRHDRSGLASSGQTPCDAVIEGGEIIQIPNLRDSLRFSRNEWLLEIGALSFLGVPVEPKAISSRVCLCLFAREPRSWTETDLAELRTYAELAAEIIDAQLNARRLSIVLDHVPDAVMFFDQTSRLVLANDRTRQLYGLSEQVLVRGATSDQLFDARERLGNHPIGEKDDYLFWLNGSSREKSLRLHDFPLHDGRTIRVRAQSTPEEGLVVSHADVTEMVKTQKALRQSEQMYRLLAENVSEVIILGSVSGKRLFHSAAIQRLLGYTPEEAQHVRTRDHVHPDDLEALKRTTAALDDTTPTGFLRYRARHKEGYFIWVEASYRRFVLPNGQPAIVTLLRDISERVKAEVAHDRMFNQGAVGMFRINQSGRPTRVNQTLSSWLGYLNSEAMIDDIDSENCAWPTSDPGFEDFLRSVWRHGSVNSFRFSMRHRKTGECIHFSIAAWLIEDQDSNSRSVEGCVMNITEQMRAEHRLQHLAQHDLATGLLNEKAFLRRLSVKLEGMNARQSNATLVLVDVSDLYRSHGFLSPRQRSRIIPELVGRIRDVVGMECQAARTKSDQFAILLGPGLEPHATHGLIDAMLSRLSQPVRLGSIDVEVAVCIGYAEIAGKVASASETLWRNAEIALNQARDTGPNSVFRFDETLELGWSRKLAIEAALHQSPVPGVMQCVFQPQVDLRQGRVIGYEALARWTHPEIGSVSPAEFIAIAERSGTIQNIGWDLFGKACELVAHLPEDSRLAINISPLQLRHHGFIDQVERILSARAIAPARIELELTESVLIDSSADMVMLLDHLRQMGFTISIDDFGTGFSSLSYLTKFPFDRVKIDRSFVNSIDQEAPAMILRSVLGMCEAINKEVIVEGVETQEQAKWLVQHGARYGQGYLFGRPLGLEQIVKVTRMKDKAAQPAEMPDSYRVPALRSDVELLQAGATMIS